MNYSAADRVSGAAEEVRAADETGDGPERTTLTLLREV